ncbi:MAG: hypothetical protein ACKVKF_18450 [Rhodobacterales bacterium]|uniref:hypothetical protein n=1 Tax=Puniceibacterium antarcticum TaxID=1206336 RepID=UPI00117B9E74|nr:hypothetical protein [Puniceibacterium antarcticum]
MAIISFLLGSGVGAAIGLIGWIVFELSVKNAVSLYIITGISIGFCLIALGMWSHSRHRGSDTPANRK